MTNKSGNPFLVGEIKQLYLRTAFPIITVFLVNGCYNLVNAFFVGRYIGEAAISAVTLVFPAQMLIFAVASLFSSGMASVIARRLGAGKIAEAKQIFSNTHILGLVVFLTVGLLFAMFGKAGILYFAGGNEQIAALSEHYISILVYCSPILAMLVVNTDALRSEGRVKFMSSVMLMSALVNVLLDYVLIVHIGLGITASAVATVLAQTASLMIIQAYRLRGKAILSLDFSGTRSLRQHMAEVLPLGIPQGLSHVGIAITVGVVNHGLMVWDSVNYQTMAGAYGIVIRVMTFAILPVIGLGVSLQTILGNNYGAGLHDRVDKAFKIGFKSVLAYCLAVELILLFASPSIGRAFVSEGLMANEAGRIARFLVAAFFLFGPAFVISSYFQAIGRAKRAILLGLSKNYLFFWPLVLVLPFYKGELGIWLSFPVADVFAATLALLVYGHYAKRNSEKLAWPSKGA